MKPSKKEFCKVEKDCSLILDSNIFKSQVTYSRHNVNSEIQQAALEEESSVSSVISECISQEPTENGTLDKHFYSNFSLFSYPEIDIGINSDVSNEFNSSNIPIPKIHNYQRTRKKLKSVVEGRDNATTNAASLKNSVKTYSNIVATKVKSLPCSSLLTCSNISSMTLNGENAEHIPKPKAQISKPQSSSSSAPKKFHFIDLVKRFSENTNTSTLSKTKSKIISNVRPNNKKTISPKETHVKTAAACKKRKCNSAEENNICFSKNIQEENFSMEIKTEEIDSTTVFPDSESQKRKTDSAKSSRNMKQKGFIQKCLSTQNDALHSDISSCNVPINIPASILQLVPLPKDHFIKPSENGCVELLINDNKTVLLPRENVVTCPCCSNQFLLAIRENTVLRTTHENSSIVQIQNVDVSVSTSIDKNYNLPTDLKSAEIPLSSVFLQECPNEDESDDHSSNLSCSYTEDDQVQKEFSMSSQASSIWSYIAEIDKDILEDGCILKSQAKAKEIYINIIKNIKKIKHFEKMTVQKFCNIPQISNLFPELLDVFSDFSDIPSKCGYKFPKNIRKSLFWYVINDYVQFTLYEVLKRCSNPKEITTDVFLDYAVKNLNFKECVKIFQTSRILTLEEAIGFLTYVGMLMTFDEFRMQSY